MKIKSSDITCTSKDFLEALDDFWTLSKKSIDNQNVKKIKTATKYFAKKYWILIWEDFDVKLLLEKMKQSDDFTDIWLAKKVEEILWYNTWLEKHYKDALDASTMTLKVSIDWKVLWANRNFLDISWYTLEELLWKEIRQLSWLFSREKPKEYWANLWNTILSGNIWSGNIKNITKNWIIYWTKTTIIPKITAWEIEYFTVVKIDITENEKLRTDFDRLKDFTESLFEENIKLWRKSMIDSLTGLYNKATFDDILDEEISRAQRINTNLSLILFDVDYFKRINDTYWHPIWDDVLKLISNELFIITRNNDFKFRIGWEEFAIILVWETLESTKEVAEKIRKHFENLNVEWIFNWAKEKITMSFGITFFNNNWIFSDEKENIRRQVYEQADKALYKAKISWRNCVKVFQEM